ncbi:tRNA (adenosine(37)-N6)-threonylcarbamoyltransferase complex ATPase subunit type 1 TsaE [Ornithobacterium rhinotracheale]|uniref:tRNA threonylcarbamoyladenosine biosynthesis protein TsaE n=1 Tax=Ornithobacterium rhinotracheale (strain ATCC 51463 / DSM 15997 / CCUG 23171 / CIP 104009 / LMG 9086) TaxID=867902 RepID=I3ZZ96_ORNRL|nr:tRNA (adenosine(37)-N6)-threonylcarbamoyltransferase complex ATPase subunit type 1 TsaE [Ornithobacterium rhinotracheale]AFL97030.1 ATPase, YjeE family [Ornithobacterium rhinotracheale DSM 15997]AIP99158.1 P-loop hydrolase [Ornithobacterium rhinotracheale ORT-UMN 88]KGB67034.1 P-loop hydrolase [Ornithobacterium rhinotracheale H06-030791]MBN3663015.1 tRNA (adenosine(37)-N6)-threonylcarbamoyltransferase complex ATPase subunit type 1 TsaE [Ornithobacterium rhinotracheale]MCK0194452.1 tRNA (ade
MQTFIAKTENDLPQIAQAIVAELNKPVVLFRGEMGVGKTTLITAMLRAMHSQDEASSPTYALVHEYQTSRGAVYHFDFYRINSEEEAYDMGWEEYAYSGDFCFVEWPEKIENLLPENHHTINIENHDGERHISFT